MSPEEEIEDLKARLARLETAFNRAVAELQRTPAASMLDQIACDARELKSRWKFSKHSMATLEEHGLTPVRIGKKGEKVERDNLHDALKSLVAATAAKRRKQTAAAKPAEPIATAAPDLGKPSVKRKRRKTSEIPREDLAAKLMLTKTEAAHYLGCSVHTINRAIDTGRLTEHRNLNNPDGPGVIKRSQIDSAMKAKPISRGRPKKL